VRYCHKVTQGFINCI